jgi:hypothetical protein
MKRKINSVYLLFFVLLSAVFQLSNSGNPPNGNTGAPPSGNTCASSQGGCHSGGTGTGMVTITGLPTNTTPNTVYPITVTVTRTNGVPSLAGFQLVTQQSNNNNAGVLSGPGPNSNVEFSGGKYYFEHSPAQPYTGNSATFTVNWTAPASATNPITMYAAANLADGNGNTSGDAIVLSTASTTLIGGGPITVNVTGTNVSCFGGNNGSATASATGGGGPPYTYNWSNGGSGPTINNLAAGTYTVSVTNTMGGSGTGSITITQPTQLTVAIVSQMNITCINPIGTATAQASGGTPPYTYNWSNGQSGPSATLMAGTHTVSVTDGNGCLAMATVTITSNTTPPTAEAGPPAVITCTTPTPMLNGTGSSTGGNIQYQWTTVDGNIISGATTLTPTVGAAGTYTLTVTNTTNGCTASDNTTVTTSTTPPVSNAGPDGLLNCTITTLQLNGNSSSQGNNFTYLWTTADGHIVSGATTLTPTVDEPGTYCLRVTNNLNGCTANDCASVTENVTPPVANAGSAPPLTCTTLQVTLNGSASSQGPNFSYLWTTTNGNIVSGATTLMPVVNVAAVYTLTVTNANNGCTASSSVTVASNTTPPTASAGPDKVLNCNNTSVVLNGSGSSQGPNFTYNWTGPGIQSGSNTPNPTVNAAGTYVILVTNTNNGCTSTDTALVTQTPALNAAISASQNVACNGGNTGSATAAASGGTGPYTYAWSNNANTPQITNIAAGTYTVSITDADNCSDTASVVITQPPALSPNATATGETSVGANDGTASASPTGGVPGYTYAWSNGPTTPTIMDLAPGNYTVSVTDANNCTASQTVTVASFSCAGVGVNMSSVNPSCNGGADGTASAVVTGSMGPYEFTWSNGDTTSTISNLTAGSYTVSVLDGNGCEVTGNVSLVAPTALNLTVQQTNVACHGDSSGMATVNATGGTPGYEYNWSNGGSGASQSDLPAGTYTVSVTDENGCEATIQVIISQPPALAGMLTATGESGVDENDGTASVSASGGVAPYTYLWSNDETTSAITGLAPGQYCVVVTDANGCTFSGCATVAPFGCTGQTLAFSVENVSCAGADDGSAQVTATGFEDPLTYLWSNGGTGNSVGNLTAGEYTVIVTDANGCQSSDTVEVTEPVALSVEVLTINNLSCQGFNDGAISVSGNGGTPGYAYSWSNGKTSAEIFDLEVGSYQVSISDENDCTATMSFDITVLPDTIPPVALAKNITSAIGMFGTFNLNSGMVDDGSYDLCGNTTSSLDVTSFDCDDIGENIVTLTITDASGNSSSAIATVTIVDDDPPTIDCPSNISVTGGGCESPVDYTTPTADDNCNNTTASLVSGPESGAIFPSGTTTVTWRADDGNGNIATCSFTVAVISNFTVGTAFTEPSCSGDNDGTATALPSGGTDPYSYAWNDPDNQTTQTATGLTAGTYSVVVSDAQGCVTTQMVQVTEPAALSIEVDAVQDAIGGPNGFIEITASGGTGSYAYEWLFNGAFFSNEQDIDGLWDGEYTLVITDQNGCKQQLTVVIDFLDATEELDLERRITIAPNPSAGRVFVDFNLEREYLVNLQVMDMSGRLVMPPQHTFVANKAIELDLGAAAPGVYLLRMIVNESVVVKRLVVGR